MATRVHTTWQRLCVTRVAEKGRMHEDLREGESDETFYAVVKSTQTSVKQNL